MAELYRKSMIERLSSVERTDKTMELTSPLSWLCLVGITLIIVVTLIWAFMGSLPVVVSANGIVASPNSTNAVYIDDTGTIVSVIVREGMSIGIGDEVLTYKNANGDVLPLLSSQNGVVSEVLVKANDTVKQGSEVMRISPYANSRQVVVVYVPKAQTYKITPGEDVQVYMDGVDRQTYGYMWARVINVDTHASSSSGMQYVVGTDNNLIASLQNSGAVSAVTCEFYPCPEDKPTVSGYDCSTPKGGTLLVNNGSTVSVKIVVEETKPIEKMFSKVKDVWGGN